MKRLALSLLFLLLVTSAFAATTTTYYQDRAFTWKSGTGLRVFGLQFTAQDGSQAEVNWLNAAPGSCSGQCGFVFYTTPDGVEQPEATVTLTSYGPTIIIPGQHGCGGPSSAHVEFTGGEVDFTFTYFYSPLRYAGCQTRTLTGTLTLTN